MTKIFCRSMYNKTIIRFGFCDIQNNQGLGKGYQPQPSASADNSYLDLDYSGYHKISKYRDLSVASRSIICRSRRLRQIIDLRDTDKSRYFAITEFNNCFISRSPSLFSYFNHFLTAQGSDLPFFSRERGSNYA